MAWRVGERVVCAGQIDALFADKYGYYYVRVCRGCNRSPCVLYAHAARLWSLLGQMVDFKRTKKSIDANASAFGRTGAGPVSHVPATAFYKYSLQQSMYELMLEQTHGLRCEGGLVSRHSGSRTVAVDRLLRKVLLFCTAFCLDKGETVHLRMLAL